MANKFPGYRRQISPSSVWLWQKLPIPGPEEMPVTASGTALPSGTNLPNGLWSSPGSVTRGVMHCGPTLHW